MNGKEKILQLSGAISPVNNHYEDVLESTIHLLAFAFQKGKKFSNAETIYKKILTQSGFWFPEVFQFTKFGLFENELKFANAENKIARQYHQRII